MRTQALLLVNPRSGRGDPSPDQLIEEARRRGIETRVLSPGDDVRALATAPVVGVAGGDGSLARVAEAVLERDAAFVCVPFGTRNHFARDVGLDRDDPVAALDAFTEGVERAVDVGAINGRVFLNNVSLGTYAGLVHRREHHRRRGEALARARALVAVARHRHRLHATVNGERVAARVLLVGNNRYDVSLFTLGVRERLDEGVLQVWAAEGVVPTAWEERVGERFRIELPAGRIRAAIDGEPVVLEPPLDVEMRPQALRVLLPSGS